MWEEGEGTNEHGDGCDGCSSCGDERVEEEESVDRRVGREFLVVLDGL